MNLSLFQMVYIISNLFYGYTIYKAMQIFYQKRRVAIWVERIAYIGGFAFITLVYLSFQIPLFTVSINIIVFMGLSMLYIGDIKKAILSTSIIYLTLICIEIVIALLTSYLEISLFTLFEYESIFGLIAIRVISFAIAVGVRDFKNIRKMAHLPAEYWICLFMIPIVTLILLFTILFRYPVSRLLLLLSVLSTFAINLFIFYLYDHISSLVADRMDKQLAEEQNKYYEQQLQIMDTALDNYKLIRHDLRNKLSSLYGLAVAGKSEELSQKLLELVGVSDQGKWHISSGNNVIDSIINFKLQQAETMGINISVNIAIPPDLPIPAFDTAIVLGNMVDNALEAMSYIEERWIEIKIKYSRGNLIFKIKNSYDGTLFLKKGKIVSRKEDKENHGLGIKSIKTVVAKYDGDVKISYDTDHFSIKALIYLSA